jgi:hypothetical protein
VNTLEHEFDTYTDLSHFARSVIRVEGEIDAYTNVALGPPVAISMETLDFGGSSPDLRVSSIRCGRFDLLERPCFAYETHKHLYLLRGINLHPYTEFEIRLYPGRLKTATKVKLEIDGIELPEPLRSIVTGRAPLPHRRIT